MNNGRFISFIVYNNDIFKIRHKSARVCASLRESARVCAILRDSARFCAILRDSARFCEILRDSARFCRILLESAYSQSTCKIICTILQKFWVLNSMPFLNKRTKTTTTTTKVILRRLRSAGTALKRIRESFIVMIIKKVFIWHIFAL